MDKLLEVLLHFIAFFRWKIIVVNICCFMSTLEEVAGTANRPAAAATCLCSLHILSEIHSPCKDFHAPYSIAESKSCDFRALFSLV